MIESLFRRFLFLPDAATPSARSIDRLHFFVISVTFAGATLIALAALVFLVRYRARHPDAPTPAIGVSRRLELGLGGFLLSMFVLWWIIGFKQFVSVKTAPAHRLEVYVTAKQWMWKFSRPNGQRSAGVLVVPRDEPMRLVLTSRDVVHSFYVPAFRIKQDALPGRYTSIWFQADKAGTYPVYCAEYCGLDHSRMWASIVVLDANDYARWLAGDLPEPVRRAGAAPGLSGGVIGEAGLTTMAERGREAASRYACFSCHTVDGQPHVGPTWLGMYDSRVVLQNGQTVLADESYLTRSMMDPAAEVVLGFAPVMPTYQGVLRQADAVAIVEFIKSLRFAPQEPLVQLPPVVPVASASPAGSGRVNEHAEPAAPSPDAGSFGSSGSEKRPP